MTPETIKHNKANVIGDFWNDQAALLLLLTGISSKNQTITIIDNLHIYKSLKTYLKGRVIWNQGTYHRGNK